MLHARHNQGRKGAFTLLEIIVVIALIAIVSGVAVSNMGDLVPALKKPSAEKSVGAACALAYHSAWTQKKKFFVRLIPEENKIVVENSAGKTIEIFESSAGTTYAKFFYDPRDGTKIFVPAQLSEIQTIEFNPSGCATPAVISLQKDGRPTKVFQLDPFSGGLVERMLL